MRLGLIAPMPITIMAVTFGLTLVVPLPDAVLVRVGLGVVLFVAQQSNQVRVRVALLDGGRMRRAPHRPPSPRS